MLGGNQGCRGVRCQGRVGRLLPSVAGGPSGPVHVPLGASVCSPRRGPPARSGRGQEGFSQGHRRCGEPRGCVGAGTTRSTASPAAPRFPSLGEKGPSGSFLAVV